MIKIERVTGASPAFAQLIRHLDADLKKEMVKNTPFMHSSIKRIR